MPTWSASSSAKKFTSGIDLSVKGLADLIIAKQRNGPIGTVPLRFLGQYTRFENRIDDLPDEPPE